LLSYIWLEEKYLSLLSPRLERFSKRGSAWNFRCPICGDSEKNKFRARGYIYSLDGRLIYKCHNCGYGTTFSKLLKELDVGLYGEYRLELLKELRSGTYKPDKNIDTPNVVEEIPGVLSNLTKITSFPDEHPVISYLDKRKIPTTVYERLYFTTRYMEWINTIVPNKFEESKLKMDEPRLVIPFIDSTGKIFAVTGRSFKSKSALKYITIKFDENANKLYGMDKIDPNERVYIFEGPIDSFFIKNSIAFAGSSGSVPDFNDSIIILDNEPRNKEILKLMKKFISDGRHVCIWPNSVPGKDVNEMIVAGMTAAEVKDIIDKNTFYGVMASVKLSEYKQI